MDMIFGFLGLAGGIFCAIGDILFDLKGKGNKKLGTSGNIDSNWIKMSYWRFGASILVAFLGDALLGFGFYALVGQINGGHGALAAVTAVCGYVSVIAGFFVHTVLCIQPIIYKKIMETDQFKLADDVLETYYKAVLPPFLIGYGFILVASVCVIIAIVKGFLGVPKWFVLLNPFVFLLVGVSLRKIKPDWFYDLPGIILPSLGMGMFGVIAVVSMMS
ncbi:MAG: hypothetical protein NC429_08365 [Lachnospiraceae bacterium]|nr:hypothetical protein [Lachnospiraceae bacterium]MCM1233654.1 hypothetical protein [Ruminococcus flavefaciens]